MKNYFSQNFEASAHQYEDRVLLTQKVFSEVSTKNLPNTTALLTKDLPAIFNNVCHNAQNLPFRKEVRSTQVGHLFEHILLENLKNLAVKQNGHGYFKGETTWDWDKEAYGKFNIIIYSNRANLPQFSQAFDKATALLEKIYLS